MRPGGLSLVALTIAACRSEVPVEQMTLEDTTFVEARSVEELPPQPVPPGGRRGYLSVVSAGNYLLGGEWPAEANVCESRDVLELFAGIRGMRTLLVIHFDTEQENWDGNYSFVLPDTTESPEPPVARLAVQVFQESEAMGFQAMEGDVDLTTVDGHVSGSFEAVLREPRTEFLIWYVGTFDRVPTTTADELYCDQLAGEEAVDSVVSDTADTNDMLH